MTIHRKSVGQEKSTLRIIAALARSASPPNCFAIVYAVVAIGQPKTANTIKSGKPRKPMQIASTSIIRGSRTSLETRQNSKLRVLPWIFLKFKAAPSTTSAVQLPVVDISERTETMAFGKTI